MNIIERCPIDELHRFLQGDLASDLQESLEQHLDRCQACRERIVAGAGSDAEWKFARESLNDPMHQREADVTQSEESSDPGKKFQGDWFSFLRLLAPTDEPSSAGRIGPFEILGIVGSGGMGLVLKARDPSLDRVVAIKILAPHLASSPSARKRFAREARSAAAIIHDNVIAIYQVAEWNQLPYLVMPYLPDPSLQQRIEREGRLDLESALSIGLQVARGLEAAHAQGLVHRDIKPANILLSQGTERAIITDFGLARASDDASLTRAGMLSGTPHYMSPEQARGEGVDSKSDLFSLGSLLFVMLAGQPPVNKELASETIVHIARHGVPSLHEQGSDIPAWMIRLIDRLHAFKPSSRPESARHVAELLEQCLAHLRQPKSQPLPKELLVRKRDRGMKLAVISFMLVAATLVVAVLNWRTELERWLEGTQTPLLQASVPEPKIESQPQLATDEEAIESEESQAIQPEVTSQIQSKPIDWSDDDEAWKKLMDEGSKLDMKIESIWSEPR